MTAPFLTGHQRPRKANMTSSNTHTHTEGEREDERMKPHFQIIIVEANTEEVTEGYVLLSPPTYPEGGFNRQSSPTFLSTSGRL